MENYKQIIETIANEKPVYIDIDITYQDGQTQTICLTFNLYKELFTQTMKLVPIHTLPHVVTLIGLNGNTYVIDRNHIQQMQKTRIYLLPPRHIQQQHL